MDGSTPKRTLCASQLFLPSVNDTFGKEETRAAIRRLSETETRNNVHYHESKTRHLQRELHPRSESSSASAAQPSTGRLFRFLYGDMPGLPRAPEFRYVFISGLGRLAREMLDQVADEY